MNNTSSIDKDFPIIIIKLGNNNRCSSSCLNGDQKVKRCYTCNRPIYFGSQKSRNGKAIPLDLYTQEPHSCRDQDVRDFNMIKGYKKSKAELIS